MAGRLHLQLLAILPVLAPGALQANPLPQHHLLVTGHRSDNAIPLHLVLGNLSCCNLDTRIGLTLSKPLLQLLGTNCAFVANAGAAP